MDAWRIRESVKALALAPEGARAPRAALRPQARCRSRRSTSAPARSRRRTRTRCTSAPKPPGFMCGVWVALEDMDMDNGPLVYYPGSHRLPEVTMQELGLRCQTRTTTSEYEEHVAERDRARGARARVRDCSTRGRRSCGRRTCCTAARRSADREPQPPQPGHARLLRGLQVLHADAERRGRDPLARSGVDRLTTRRALEPDPVRLQPRVELRRDRPRGARGALAVRPWQQRGPVVNLSRLVREVRAATWCSAGSRPGTRSSRCCSRGCCASPR